MTGPVAVAAMFVTVVHEPPGSRLFWYSTVYDWPSCAVKTISIRLASRLRASMATVAVNILARPGVGASAPQLIGSFPYSLRWRRCKDAPPPSGWAGQGGLSE